MCVKAPTRLRFGLRLPPRGGRLTGRLLCWLRGNWGWRRRGFALLRARLPQPRSLSIRFAASFAAILCRLGRSDTRASSHSRYPSLPASRLAAKYLQIIHSACYTAKKSNHAILWNGKILAKHETHSEEN